jgi:hypothetical protein
MVTLVNYESGVEMIFDYINVDAKKKEEHAGRLKKYEY